MTEHEQQQPWTDETLQALANQHAIDLGGNESAYHLFLQSHQEMRDAWQADRDALTAKLDAAEQRIAELERNGHTPQRDTVGGQITAEWDTPQEDAAWAHLRSEDGDE